MLTMGCASDLVNRYELRPHGPVGQHRRGGVDLHLPDVAVEQTQQRRARLLTAECNQCRVDSRFTAFQFQSLRSAGGSVLGTDQLSRNLQILPAQSSPI